MLWMSCGEQNKSVKETCCRGTGPSKQETAVKPEMIQNKSLRSKRQDYICDVEITWIPESASLGISETERLDNSMVRQRLLLCCRNTRVGEVVSCRRNMPGCKPRITRPSLLFISTVADYQTVNSNHLKHLWDKI